MNATNESIRRVFLFAGGGTGGHLFPAIAIAQKIRQEMKNSEIEFVGTKQGLEYRVIPKLGYRIHYISVRGLRRKLTPSNVLVPFRLVLSFIQCAAILRRVRPCAVIGTGGYVSGPMLFMASRLGYPTVVQEQNSYPGVTTRLLARWVDRVHLSFEASRAFFRNQSNLFVTGNPVRDFARDMTREQARARFQLTPERPVVLVFGGSQGALAINRAMLGALDEVMASTPIQLLWSTGPIGYEEVKAGAEKYADRIRVYEFIEDMGAAYAASDLAVCRAGATTLAEITVCGLPAILIPYPYAAAGHQEANARTLEAAGAARVVLEKELSGKLLAKEIEDFFRTPDLGAKMSEAARSASFPNATSEIVRSIFEVAGIKE